MKSQKDLKTRARQSDPDEIRRPSRLAPAHKGGNDGNGRHSFYGEYDDFYGEYDDDLDFENDLRPDRESVLDYFDVEEEEAVK